MKKLTLILTSLFLPTVVLAGPIPKGTNTVSEKITVNNADIDLVGFLSRIKGVLLGFAGAVAVLFIIYGGFLYVTSGGNKQQAETAKKTITWAVAGLGLIVLSNLVLGLLTGANFLSIFK